jgi:hypothetical protein
MDLIPLLYFAGYTDSWISRRKICVPREAARHDGDPGCSRAAGDEVSYAALETNRYGELGEFWRGCIYNGVYRSLGGIGKKMRL